MGGSPNAISVTPSKYFLGDDGNWATFQISVGTPPQSLVVYPSTLIPVTWVIPTQGCTINDNSLCPTLRGGGQLFNVNQSSSWKEAGPYYLGVETSLGFSQTDEGDYGYDSLSIAASQGAVSVQGAAIAAIDTTDSYVGQLGLAQRNVTIENATSQSLLSLLRSSNQIPSTSYSYTAGAYYNNSQLGSLTLGGFDSSRSQSNNASFDFGADPINYLNIGLQSISFTSSGKSQNLLSNAIAANIDSTVSAFWLPNDTCNAIADAYGLTFNQLNQLYTINGSQHADNVKNNPQLSFQLSNTVAGGGPSVSINFPYAAFRDMNFTNPNENAASPIQIFPLRQASSSSQYTLGRTFLQEAVLTVDFDRQNFSLAQAIPVSSGTQPRIVNINAPGSGGGSSTSNPSSPSSTGVTAVAAPSSFSSGAIAGTVVGIVGAIAIGIAAFFFWRKHHRKSRKGPINTDTSTVMPSTKLLPPELGNVQGQDQDYFTSKAPAPPYVSENEVKSELDSPNLHGTRFASSQQSSPPVISTENGPAELPVKDPTASELNSRTVSFNSSVGPFAGFTSAGPSRLSPSNSPLVELSPDPNRISSPTAATGAEGSWNQTHLEPGSPESPRSVSMQKAGGAHIVNHKKNASSSSPTFHSSHSSVDQNGMSATMINNWNEPGLGFSIDDPRRQNLHRNSRGSQSTLVGGASGRASPEAGIPPNNTTPSAFQSPEMMPIQRPNSPPTTMLYGAQGDVESPGEIDEGPRRG